MKNLSKAKGGRARAAKLSPKNRRDIAKKAAKARWNKKNPAQLGLFDAPPKGKGRRLPKAPLDHLGRFVAALRILTGKAPPVAMAKAWLETDDEELQMWVLEQKGTPEWAQGIVIIDAARLIADNPVESPDYRNEERTFENRIRYLENERRELQNSVWDLQREKTDIEKRLDSLETRTDHLLQRACLPE